MKNEDFQPWKNIAINILTPPHSGAPKGCFPGLMLLGLTWWCRHWSKTLLKWSGILTGLFCNDLELGNVLDHIAERNSDWVSLKRPQGCTRTHKLPKKGPRGATRPNNKILDLIKRTNHEEPRVATTISQHSWIAVYFTVERLNW